MFLYVNPQGNRHLLFDTFAQLIEFFRNVPSDKFPTGKVRFTCLEPGKPGKYDLVLDLVKETVSGKRWYKGFFILNPHNKPYFNKISQNDLFATMLGTSLCTSSTEYDGKRYDIVANHGDSPVNGHLSFDDEPPLVGQPDFYSVLALFFNGIKTYNGELFYE